MTTKGARPLAWCLATVTVAGMPAALLIDAKAGEHGFGPVEIVWNYAAMAMFLAVGLTLALKVPSNPIGWLLMVLAASTAIDGLTGAFAGYALEQGDADRPLVRLAGAWESSWWPLWFALVGSILVLLPDGRLPSRRWRPVAVVGLVAVALTFVGGVLGDEQRINALQDIEAFGVLPPGVAQTLVDVGMTGVTLTMVLVVVAMVVRYRGGTTEVRTQLKWIASAAVLFPVACGAWAIESVATHGPAVVTQVVLGLGIAAFCCAIAVAVLRYRLYDLDLVINKALVYGSLTVVVGVGYAGLVAGLDRLLGSRGWAGVIAAGSVAVAVQPLRERLQRQVDRRLYGYRSDPYEAMRLLGDRLHATLAPAQVLQTIVGSVAEALRVPYVAVTFAREGEPETAAVHGVLGRARPESRPLPYRGETVAELVIGVPQGRELTSADERLLDDLAVQAGVAVYAVRLTDDLQHSRERLVSAREEERRRVRRDLHDGLGPTLAAAVLSLDASRRAVTDDPEQAERLLVDLRTQMQDAIADVRRLVYELRPPALDQLGLVGALREHAARVSEPNGGLKVVVESSHPMPSLPAAVEVAAYRIAMEAMKNVQTHAEARRCTVQFELDEELALEIADDGKGVGSLTPSGVGLQSMRERARELGGTLTIAAREGGGTRVVARLPVGAS